MYNIAINNLGNLMLPNDKLIDLLTIYEAKGSSFYYKSILEKKEESFRKNRYFENIYFFAKYINLKLDDEKLKKIVLKDYVARNKSEIKLRNLKEIFSKIDLLSSDFSISSDEIINLAKLITRDIHINTISPLNEELVSKLVLSNMQSVTNSKTFLQAYCNNFLNILHKKKSELIQLLLALFLDLRLLELFKYENSIISWVIFYSYLEQKISIFRYVSFFKHLYNHKDEMEKLILISSANYNSGLIDIMGMLGVIIDICKEALAEIKIMANSFSFEIKRNKSSAIENFILKGPQVFYKDSIRKEFPRISEITIDRTLRRLRDENKIMPLGTGRSASWQRIVEGEEDITKLELETYTLFEDI